MFIKVTNSQNKNEIYIHAGVINLITRNNQNLMETVINTTIMTPQGMAMYMVVESPSEVHDLVEAALRSSAAASGTMQ